jgi:hypothetical protein
VDCEKFDRVVLDLLYEELDELTAAAAQRHMDHCARCGPIGNGLRATREIGVLPAIESPIGLRERILEAERSARSELTFHQRAGRTISVLAGYAMRPQLAMAAVLILMVGMSLMLLQPRPGSRDSMRITERGVPEGEVEALSETPLTEPAPAGDAPSGVGQAHGALRSAAEGAADRDADAHEAAKAEGDAQADPFQVAMRDFRAGRYAQSRTAFESIAERGGDEAPRAELMAARAARYANGCETSVALLENVSAKHPGTGVAHEADWFAATCYRDLGRTARATQKLTALRDVPEYSERARNVLDQLSAGVPVAARPRAAAAAKPKPAAKPGKPATTALDAAEEAAPEAEVDTAEALQE